MNRLPHTHTDFELINTRKIPIITSKYKPELTPFFPTRKMVQNCNEEVLEKDY